MKQKKLFVLKKYVMACTAQEAIKKDPETEVSGVWEDEEWKKERQEYPPAIGFQTNE